MPINSTYIGPFGALGLAYRAFCKRPGDLPRTGGLGDSLNKFSVTMGIKDFISTEDCLQDSLEVILRKPNLSNASSRVSLVYVQGLKPY